jgi:hypothetical protein
MRFSLSWTGHEAQLYAQGGFHASEFNATQVHLQRAVQGNQQA